MTPALPAPTGPDVPPDPARDERVPVGTYATATAGFERGVALIAAGIPCWLDETAGAAILFVPPHHAAGARAQLAAYERENLRWPPRPRTYAEAPFAGGAWLTPLLWVAAELASFAAQVRFPGWTERGVLDASRLVAHAEWWRPFTALFLHADPAHLVGNLVCGALIFRTVILTYRSRRFAWLWLGLAAVSANTIDALMYGGSSPYRSLGASTAVFAGLGLLTGRALRRPVLPNRWRALLVPLAAGLTLLGLYGAGGGDAAGAVDVLAHVTGFVSGTALGGLVSRPPRAPDRRPHAATF